MASVSFGPPSVVVIKHDDQSESQSKSPKKFAWLRPTNKMRRMNSSGTPSDASSVAATLKSRGTLTSKSNNSGSDHYAKRHPTNIDYGNSCSECGKKFRIGKRYKHHCSRCMATFCHKHGRTTHNNFTSCKVPGDCICNSCLKIVASRSSLTKQF